MKAARNSAALKGILKTRCGSARTRCASLATSTPRRCRPGSRPASSTRYEEGKDSAGKTLLAVGYGSGDAAEAIPLQVVAGWEQAAAKIGVARALAGAVELTREQYERRHDGTGCGVALRAAREFVVERVGSASRATSRTSASSTTATYPRHTKSQRAAE